MITPEERREPPRRREPESAGRRGWASWVRGGFAVLGRARSAPAFHPSGRVLTGEVHAVDGCPPWFPLPVEPTPALVRVSKGVGLPGGAPDILGLGIRTTVDGLPWDLLLSSCGPGPLRGLPSPGLGWDRALYSSIVALVGDGGRGVLRAVPRGLPSGTRLDALVPALPFGWDLRLNGARVGLLDVTAVVEQEVGFDPLGNAAGLRTSPRWLAALREPAYVGSRTGRHASTHR
ncbi:hypothetical protein L6E12_11555 [Actinokineospora sp. PR83]|uniref:hypothetical protein n=1 Tax=Actinokineospora sp. PR83 TaxID=2884908 RepID=UPI001F19C5FC|nr:hypothetical protein [Actinokineospora sp. PR83]MCG8916425.1 hypothetical protein [Actinokineospora sp. PR83]